MFGRGDESEDRDERAGMPAESKPGLSRRLGLLAPSSVLPSPLPLTFPPSCPDCSPPSFSSAASNSRSWPRWWASGSRSCTETTSRRSCGASAGSTGPGCCVGVGLASMDWLGGGLRIWVVARHVHPESLAQGDDPGRRDGGLGRLHHAAQFGRGADDDVHHAALRGAAAGRGDVHLHELRGDDPLLRHRGAAGAAVRRRAVAGPAGQRAGPLAVRSVPGKPDDHRRHRRADGRRDLLSQDGARPDPSGRGVGRAAEPAGRRSAGAAQAGDRRGPRERHRLQQSGRLAGALLGHAALGARPTPTSCSPATSRSAPSVSTPTSSTSS